MKIRPVILCGGAGSRLWPDNKNHQAKQFIDFGGWTLFGKTLERIKNPIFDYPIISTNLKYLKEIKKYLKKYKVKRFKIVLEPAKKNTGPAILSSILIPDIPNNQPIIFLPSDHLIEKIKRFNYKIQKNKRLLTNNNIFIFGIKPVTASDQYGYFLTKKIGNTKKVSKFFEKPIKSRAKALIKKGGYWNGGMFFVRKDSLLNNFRKFQKKNVSKFCFSIIQK